MSESTNIEHLLRANQAEVRPWGDPIAFDLADKSHQDGLSEAFANGQVTEVVDNISQIADDLFELTDPENIDDPSKRAAFTADIASQGASFGTWFLFPWSKQLVRFPDAQDHRALLTFRNKNLVTALEQEKLYKAAVAVCGLSVGSHAVDQLVLSGTGGKIIMADYDTLAPSNLNRIRAGFDEVGSQKIDIAAKKISLRDPYLEQVHFRQGVTADNLDQLAAEKPDIVVDEVDNLSVKALLRGFAAQRNLPVLMATDLADKSMLDVERYDLESPKPFHGKLKPEQVTALANGRLSAEEQKALVPKIVGIRNVSARMLQSVMGIGSELAGMPQLGVTASVGGSLVATASREILLGRKLDTGRYVYDPKAIMSLEAPQGRIDAVRTFVTFVKSQKSK